MVHLAPVNDLGAADTLGTFAILAVILFNGAWRPVPMPFCIQRRRHVTGPERCLLQRGTDFIPADDKVHFLVPVQGACDPVPCPVNVHDLSCLRKPICRQQEDIRNEDFTTLITSSGHFSDRIFFATPVIARFSSLLSVIYNRQFYLSVSR